MKFAIMLFFCLLTPLSLVHADSEAPPTFYQCTVKFFNDGDEFAGTGMTSKEAMANLKKTCVDSSKAMNKSTIRCLFIYVYAHCDLLSSP